MAATRVTVCSIERGHFAETGSANHKQLELSSPIQFRVKNRPITNLFLIHSTNSSNDTIKLVGSKQHVNKWPVPAER